MNQGEFSYAGRTHEAQAVQDAENHLCSIFFKNRLRYEVAKNLIPVYRTQ